MKASEVKAAKALIASPEWKALIERLKKPKNKFTPTEISTLLKGLPVALPKVKLAIGKAIGSRLKPLQQVAIAKTDPKWAAKWIAEPTEKAQELIVGSGNEEAADLLVSRFEELEDVADEVVEWAVDRKNTSKKVLGIILYHEHVTDGPMRKEILSRYPDLVKMLDESTVLTPSEQMIVVKHDPKLFKIINKPTKAVKAWYDQNKGGKPAAPVVDLEEDLQYNPEQQHQEQLEEDTPSVQPVRRGPKRQALVLKDDLEVPDEVPPEVVVDLKTEVDKDQRIKVKPPKPSVKPPQTAPAVPPKPIDLPPTVGVKDKKDRVPKQEQIDRGQQLLENLEEDKPATRPSVRVAPPKHQVPPKVDPTAELPEEEVKEEPAPTVDLGKLSSVMQRLRERKLGGKPVAPVALTVEEEEEEDEDTGTEGKQSLDLQYQIGRQWRSCNKVYFDLDDALADLEEEAKLAARINKVDADSLKFRLVDRENKEIVWTRPPKKDGDKGLSAEQVQEKLKNIQTLMVESSPFPSEPDNWIFMNAARPLLGNKTFDNGEFLAGRHYAAIDPSDSMAARWIEENRKLDAYCLMVVPIEEQRLMALHENSEYAEAYLEMEESERNDQLKTAIGRLQRLSWGTLRDLHAAALQAGYDLNKKESTRATPSADVPKPFKGMIILEKKELSNGAVEIVTHYNFNGSKIGSLEQGASWANVLRERGFADTKLIEGNSWNNPSVMVNAKGDVITAFQPEVGKICLRWIPSDQAPAVYDPKIFPESWEGKLYGMQYRVDGGDWKPYFQKFLHVPLEKDIRAAKERIASDRRIKTSDVEINIVEIEGDSVKEQTTVEESKDSDRLYFEVRKQDDDKWIRLTAQPHSRGRIVSELKGWIRQMSIEWAYPEGRIEGRVVGEDGVVFHEQPAMLPSEKDNPNKDVPPANLKPSTVSAFKKAVELGKIMTLTDYKIGGRQAAHRYLNKPRRVSEKNSVGIALMALDGEGEPSYLDWPKRSQVFQAGDNGFVIISEEGTQLAYSIQDAEDVAEEAPEEVAKQKPTVGFENLEEDDEDEDEEEENVMVDVNKIAPKTPKVKPVRVVHEQPVRVNPFAPDDRAGEDDGEEEDSDAKHAQEEEDHLQNRVQGNRMTPAEEEEMVGELRKVFAKLNKEPGFYDQFKDPSNISQRQLIMKVISPALKNLEKYGINKKLIEKFRDLPVKKQIEIGEITFPYDSYDMLSNHVNK